MAKLYFYYSAMNAGKSTVLLQSAYNYREKGMQALLFTPEIDQRFGIGKITSRIGLDSDAVSFDRDFDFFDFIQKYALGNSELACVLIDEAQFLTKRQVQQLTFVVDQLNIPVLVYGLRTDFQGEPFEGSLYLLLWADNLVEIKTICFCGKKAMMNARMDPEGHIVTQGDQVKIGGNDTYVAMCRKHFNEKLLA